MRRHALALAVAAVALMARPAAAGPIAVGIVGDSISDYYYHYQGQSNPNAGGLPYWGSAGDRNWVEQLLKAHGPALTAYNYALAGATTGDILNSTAAYKASIRTHYFHSSHAVVIAGSNDVLNFLKNPGDPAAFVKSIAANVNGILSKIDAAGPVHLVVGNIPDLAVTPSMKGLLHDAAALGQLTGLIQSANEAIAHVAQAHGAAVVDLFAISHAADGTLTLGGTDVPTDKLFAPDGFHPGTVLQGLLGDAILAAFGDGISSLRLSDQEILTNAKIPHADGPPTFFDVSGFVHQTPEPASAVLLVLAVGLAGARRRGKRN